MKSAEPVRSVERDFDVIDIPAGDFVDNHDDDNEMALRGIIMLLNNKWKESVALFDKYKDHSSVMHFGSVFVSYLQAMMSLEDEKITAAKKLLEELEKKCHPSKSIFKRIRNKVKGQVVEVSQEDRWISQIVVADALLYQAILTFINQDIPSYLRGGWLLRRAWKVYSKLHAAISKHSEECSPNGTVVVDVDAASDDPLAEDDNATNENAANTSHSRSAQNGASAIPPPGGSQVPFKETISAQSLNRLLGAVSFGFGLFQLGLSLIPDKVLKLIEFLGFEANREAGLAALECCSESSDLRAPLAVLGLLWYHTIMKPFFTHDASLTTEELKESLSLIEKYQSLYPESSLFLFFKGRLLRLQKDIDSALDIFTKAQDCSNGQTELYNAALFEIAWCNMMKLNYDISRTCFAKLSEESKWSKSFYTYMQAICAGSIGDIETATQAMKTVPGLVKKKTNQIEAFVSRRAQQFKKAVLRQDTCELLVLELLYMWNCIPQCSSAVLDKMLSVCAQVEDKGLFHLRSLVEGAIHKQLGDAEFSLQCFKESVARQEGMKFDQHIAAHALFEMGVVLITANETHGEGRKMLLKAKDGFKEYDFENRLNVRIRAVLKLYPA